MSYLKSVLWNLSKCKVFQKNPKIPEFPTKNPLSEYFWARSLKNYCHISNQHVRICLIKKFCEGTTVSEFWTKNVIFGSFQLKMSYFGILGEEFLKNFCHIW